MEFRDPAALTAVCYTIERVQNARLVSENGTVKEAHIALGQVDSGEWRLELV